MAKKSRHIVSIFRLIGLLLALITFYLCLMQGLDIASSIFRGLIIYAGFQIISLLGYNFYLILALRAIKNAEDKGKNGFEEIRKSDNVEVMDQNNYSEDNQPA